MNYDLPDLPPPAGNNIPAELYAPALLIDAPNLSSANVARWFDHDADNQIPAPKSTTRVRRRMPPGSDHVKHRRTRSGCYTCRSRRVKVKAHNPLENEPPWLTILSVYQCDETHPVCKSQCPTPSSWSTWANISFDDRVCEGIKRVRLSRTSLGHEVDFYLEIGSTSRVYPRERNFFGRI